VLTVEAGLLLQHKWFVPETRGVSIGRACFRSDYIEAEFSYGCWLREDIFL
jgi:hypothetical protein